MLNTPNKFRQKMLIQLMVSSFTLLASQHSLAENTDATDNTNSPNTSAAPAASDSKNDAVLTTIKVTAKKSVSATTEGTDNYAAQTATVGLGQHSLQETPNSASVITRQRIEDQNLNTVEDAMRYTPAVLVESYGPNTSGIQSRGYTIDHFQYDGISSSANAYAGGFDLAMFDRVEVLRGVSSLLGGASEPGGTINFVRKRALDHFALSAETMVGSYDYRYANFDVTGPLNSDATLRGRFIVSDIDRNYSTDLQDKKQPSVYGTLEYDIDPATTISIGSMWQRAQYRPSYGLANYPDGTFPNYSRSFFPGAAWNNDVQETSRSFAELLHHFDNGITGKLTASYYHQSSEGQFEWGNTQVDPTTGNYDLIPYFSRGTNKEVNYNGELNIPWVWQGLKQELIVGANYQQDTSKSGYNGSTWGKNGFTLNIFNPNYNVPEPDIAIDPLSTSLTTQSAAYTQLRFKPIQPLTLVFAGRVAWYKTESKDDPSANQTSNGKFIPMAGLVYDLTHHFALYGNVSQIFDPQSATDYKNDFLPARTGNQYETGIKGSYLDGKLISNVAFYRINDNNRAINDPNHPNASIAAGEVQSQGVEAELTGKLTHELSLTAGYGYNTTRQIKASAGDQGINFNSYFPENIFSLWGDYKFSSGWAEHANVGLGYQYRGELSDTEDNGNGDTTSKQGGVSLFAIHAGYDINSHIHTSLTINNLFDKRYYDSLQNWSRQTYFGAPRNLMFTLSYKQ